MSKPIDLPISTSDAISAARSGVSAIRSEPVCTKISTPASLLELFDDRDAVDEHPRVLGIAAELAEQAGGPTGGAVAEPLAFQNLHARAAAGELHRRAQSGDAAADDDHVR